MLWITTLSIYVARFLVRREGFRLAPELAPCTLAIIDYRLRVKMGMLGAGCVPVAFDFAFYF